MYKFKNFLENLLVFSIFAILFAFIVRMFTVKPFLRILLSLFSAALTYKYFFKLRALCVRIQNQKQFTFFMQILHTELNVNNSLSQSIQNTAQNLIPKVNKRIQKQLKYLLKVIAMGAPFHEISKILLETFDCPIAQTSFSLLAEPNALGSQVNTLVENILSTLSIENKQTSELISEFTKVFVETISLALMPILIMLFLQISAQDYLALAFSSTLGEILILNAYLLFLLSLVVIPQIFIPKEYRQARNNKSKPKAEQPKNLNTAKSAALAGKKTKRAKKVKSNKIKLYFKTNARTIIAKTSFPFVYKKLERSINILIHQNYAKMDDLYYKLLLSRVRFSLYALVSAAILITYKTPVLLLIFVSICLIIYPDYQLINKAKEEINILELDLPFFMHCLVLLLSAGYNFEFALDFILKNVELNYVLSQELKLIQNKLKNGTTLNQALEDFNAKIDNYNVRIFFELIEQYSRAGSKDSLNIIKLQLQQTEQYFVDNKKRNIALKSNNYLLPMVLDLISVFIICLAPALTSLQF